MSAPSTLALLLAAARETVPVEPEVSIAWHGDAYAARLVDGYGRTLLASHHADADAAIRNLALALLRDASTVFSPAVVALRVVLTGGTP